MKNLLEFLTAKEIIVVYVFALFSCLLCIIIYVVEKNTKKARLRHNTRELNKLVEEVQEEYPNEEQIIYNEPVLEPIEEVSEASNVLELLESTMEIEKIKVDNDDSSVEVGEVLEPVIIGQVDEDIVYEVEGKEEELEYTSIEPDQETAKLELKKLAEELKEQEENNENDIISSYEEMQEETAIISLEELVKRSKEIYEANEVTQYKDEGNEPISIKELEEKTGTFAPIPNGVFSLEEVVPKEEKVDTVTKVEDEKKDNLVTLYDLYNAPYEKINDNEVKKFRSSPIISPIYGIEKGNDLQLENTANYEKMDNEIKKSNEFLMSLKELQNKIDS